MTKTDRDIAEAIAHELEWDARIGTNTIDVQVERGAVVLEGAIASWAQRLAAQDAALRVDGVRDVSNRIEVALPREARRSDVELARSVQSALDWDVLVPKGKISSSVNGGQVILEGQVDVCAQRDDAERAVRNIVGIRRLLNRISVTPLVGEDHRVQESLEGALERRAAYGVRRINLDVHDGKVILSGVVRSWAERQSVVGAAKGTRGIRSVDDRLLVEPG
jgi:osmotically-inducible protein OsmY